ncbi:MAG: hypothetical protein M1832_004421 [Thelocarpon impressellum]|nr:MAG: hypothetical protein M1832_004421 [Thelocarpon impressellum]
MVEADVATKAPESDAAAGSVFPGDTPAQQGASMGVYVSRPADYPHSPSKLLLFLTNGTGIHSVNNQLQADRFAKEGFLVVMPDMFGGDAAPNSATTIAAEQDESLLEQVKLRAAETAKSFLIDMWLARHTPEKVLPILHKVIDGTKDEFADAIANGGGVYSVGYCFGGRYTLLLGGEHPDTVAWGQAPKDEEEGVVSKGPTIKAGAIAHGTLVTAEDLKALKVPISMVCIENDQLFPDDTREEGRRHLESAKTEHEIKVYSGVPHGFAVVGEYADQKIVEAQREAFDQMLAWLEAH